MAYENGPDIPENVGPIDDEPEPDTDKIVLDATDPTIAKAFENCEVGETLTLDSKDESEVVLSKNYDGGEEADEADMPEPKSAVDRLMAAKMKG